MKSYMTTIEKAINWMNTQMLTFDNGYYGIYERIRIDEHLRTNWSRPDCSAEYMRTLHIYYEMTGEKKYLKVEENLMGWLERTQDSDEGSVWKGSFPFYLIDGYIRQGKVDASLYQNDNGKVMTVMCQLYKITEDERMLKVAKDIAEYWIKTQQSDGTYGIIDGKNMEQCRKGPCFVQWLVSGFYLLYNITLDKQYLQSAEKGMAYLISLIHPRGRSYTSYEVIKMEDWRPVSSETTIMLYTLSLAYKVTKKSVYMQKINLVLNYLLSLQHESGAILNCSEDCMDASLQNNKNLCDLVYTQGFALQSLVFAFDATGDKKILDAAYRLGDFLVGIQCSGESELWDGSWRGSYNVITKEWDGRCNQNNPIDEGGMYSVYTGWCCTNIVYGLELLEQYNIKNEKVDKKTILEKIKGGLIVSCQALQDEPLHSSIIMGKMAIAAKLGGAVGIRANSVEDICEIRKNVDLPIIGIIKNIYENSDVYITPTIKEVEMLINSPCDIIAFDATIRKRPNDVKINEIIKKIKQSGKLIMADISTYEEGIEACNQGADIISTTLSGYTYYSPQKSEPDYDLIEKLSHDVKIPVIAEGRIANSEKLLKCLKCGAYSVVVGGAITRPQLITKEFTQAIEASIKNSL